MRTPYHSLKTVKKLIDNCWFSAPSKSLHAVMAVYRDLSLEHAQNFIRAALYQLEEDHFSHSIVMWDNVADIYGMSYDGKPWYIKFIIEDNSLEEISFHPPCEELRTRSGVIKRGDYKYDDAKKVWRMW